MKKFFNSLLILLFFVSLFPLVSRWQELTCEERYFDKTLSIRQNFSYRDFLLEEKEFDEEFTKEYFLVNISSSGCDDCISEAESINQDTIFQEYFWMSWSCDFSVFVDNWLLNSWIDDIGSWTFIAEHSFELIWMTTYYLPQLFSTPVATQLPTFLLINRAWETVRRYEGELPKDRIYEYCIRDDMCLEDQQEEDETTDEDQDEDQQDNTWDNTNNDDDGWGTTDTWAGDDWWWGGWTDWSTPWSSTPWWSSNWWQGESWSSPPSWWQPGSWPWEWSQPWWNWDGPTLGIDPTPIPPSQVDQDPWRLQIEIPWESQRDVVTNESILTTSNSKDSLRITWRQINRWLRVFFGASLLVWIVYAWFKFITSLWDPEKAKAWLKTFLYIWIAFALALFAFILVRLVTNLFIS